MMTRAVLFDNAKIRFGISTNLGVEINRNKSLNQKQSDGQCGYSFHIHFFLYYLALVFVADFIFWSVSIIVCGSARFL